jgi:hypothetical protein
VRAGGNKYPIWRWLVFGFCFSQWTFQSFPQICSLHWSHHRISPDWLQAVPAVAPYWLLAGPRDIFSLSLCGRKHYGERRAVHSIPDIGNGHHESYVPPTFGSGRGPHNEHALPGFSKSKGQRQYSPLSPHGPPSLMGNMLREFRIPTPLTPLHRISPISPGMIVSIFPLNTHTTTPHPNRQNVCVPFLIWYP